MKIKILNEKEQAADFLKRLEYYLYTKDKIKHETRVGALREIMKNNPERAVPEKMLKQIEALLK